MIREFFTPTPDELRWVWHASSVPEARLDVRRYHVSTSLVSQFDGIANADDIERFAKLAREENSGVSRYDSRVLAVDSSEMSRVTPPNETVPVDNSSGWSRQQSGARPIVAPTGRIWAYTVRTT